MPEHGKINATGNDSKPKPKLFEKGGPGGPGRGKRNKTYDLTEVKNELKPRVLKTINNLLASTDLKNGAKGVELYLKLFGHEKEQDNSTMLSPEIVALFKHQLGQQQAEETEFEVIED
jgi:hypothetical protein